VEGISALTPERAQAMVRAAHRRIADRVQEINAINVFPVPDGDTGTNLALTLESALRALENVDPQAVDAAAVLLASSRGAMLGARGNSGVILSQYLRGFARALAGTDHGPEAVAQALRQAAEGAYAAVDVPVEGTILTVARRAAEAAAQARETGQDVAGVLRAAVEGAQEALAETTRLLPALREAGVVDSAGLGLMYVLEAMAEAVAAAPEEGRGHGAVGTLTLSPEAETFPPAPGRYGYEVQFLLEGEALSPEAVRKALHPLGESLVVVGDESLLRVHIHTHQPQAVLREAARFGPPQGVTVDSLDDQVEALHGQHGVAG
jgi:DAK2 domain fusion protein YloV